MMVRLLKPWKWKKVGTVISECPDGVANLLIRRGVAELHKPAKKEKPVRG